MPKSNEIRKPYAAKIPEVVPVIPLGDIIMFPQVIYPFTPGKGKTVRAMAEALASYRILLMVAQKEGSVEDPGEEDLHKYGTLIVARPVSKMPGGKIRVLVQGMSRARITELTQSDPFLKARCEVLEEPGYDHSVKTEALLRTVKESLSKAVELGKSFPGKVMDVVQGMDHPGRLADLVISNLDRKQDQLQAFLEVLDPVERLTKLRELLTGEVEYLALQQEIASETKGEMGQHQREFFLRQQLKMIQRELGEELPFAKEIEGYRALAKEKNLPEEARDELAGEILRLERSDPQSSETDNIRSHLEFLTELPWGISSAGQLDIDHAEKVLDEDHYGLQEVKERILEYLAVRKLKPDSKAPILCFLGPPGVGKTSLGRSIARALGRKFVRVAMGGIRDEAEIRGHRKTYIGAMPGRILQAIRQAGSGNPIFMLDEVDKVGADQRGDPSSALLEVLDPHQNAEFRDNYLGVAYDLSGVFFIATANQINTIQPALLDRLEILRLSGYTEEEKVKIARHYLIPRQLRENGIADLDLPISDAALKRVIRDYAREPGLRNFERRIGTLCRKVAVDVARGSKKKISVNVTQIESYLGPARHSTTDLLDRPRVGICTGLAVTSLGGDLMFIEALAVPGSGRLLLTGRLGDVMRESAQAALSVARNFAEQAGIQREFFMERDLHIHLPAGAVPKDGASAGITITTAIISLLTGRPVNTRVAMTGEITLNGRVLPIGGLKEKILAARAAGAETVIAPALSRRHVADLPKELGGRPALRFVEHINEVLDIALLDAPAEGEEQADPRG